MSLLTSTLGTTLAALAVVLGLVWLAARALRAAGLAAPKEGRRIAVAETLALDGSRRLHLLRCDGRELLLVTGGSRDTLIGWLPPGAGA